MIQGEPTCILHLKQILPARAGNAKLGLEEILVTSTYQRNDIPLYNSLQDAMIEMLLEVHLDKYTFFILGLFRDTFSCPYDTELIDRIVNEMELMWKWTWPSLRYYAVEQKPNLMAHAQKLDLVFQRNGRVHLYRRGCQFSRLLAAEMCGSAVVILDRPFLIQCTTVMANPSIRLFHLHFSTRVFPCAIRFRFCSTSIYQVWLRKVWQN